MIDTQEKTLLSYIYEAKEKAEQKRAPQLLSWSKKIHPLEIIDVFREAKQMNQNRFFWMNHTNDFSIVGVGEAEIIETEDATESRFHLIEDKWQQVLSQAMVHNPYQQMGTGLTAIGGMAFDAQKQATALWQNYPAGRLTVPAQMVVYSEEEYFYTVNCYIQPEDDVDKIINNVRANEEQLLHSNKTEDDQFHQQILSKNEKYAEAWKESVDKAVQAIQHGEANKIVMAREMRIKLNRQANVANILERLMDTQPHSYIFAIEAGEDCFVGATPERLVLLEANRLLSTCLAGTAPRGETQEEDEAIQQELFNDEKNREEHAYVVQMIKESMLPYCKDISIPEEPVLYPLRNLHHLYTPVTATLLEGQSVFDVMKRLHPTPALGGSPKSTALAFIREKENMDRGWYGAPVGWLDSNQNSEFAVAIRSGLVQQDEVSLFAGCGVMRDSVAELEYEETNVKFLPMLQVLEEQDESY